MHQLPITYENADWSASFETLIQREECVSPANVRILMRGRKARISVVSDDEELITFALNEKGTLILRDFLEHLETTAV
jgi:hypothetical protein